MGRGEAQLTRRAAALAGLCATLLPPEDGGPDPDRLGRALSRFLDRQPWPVAVSARSGAAGLDLASRLTARARLTARPPEARTELWHRLARLGPVGLGLDALKALVLLVHGADAAGEVTAAAANATAPARPDAEMDVTPSWHWPSWSRADVIVVGSGAGGAAAARTLARAGATVLVLEEGRRHTVDEFRAGLPLERFTALYRDGGTTAALGRPPVMLPVGRGVGGTTLVNSGTCYRTPERVLQRWRDQAGLSWADPPEFAGALDEVWELLQVAPVPQAVMGRNGALALAGAEALGWRAAPLERNAPGCGGCCQCAIGCPRNAKFGTHLNALPQACAAGARIVSEARVERVVVDGGRATGVLARRGDGSLFTVLADAVVVSAGATETPPLLRRSGVGHHPQLGRNLAVHPAVGVYGRFPEPVVSWRGVLQSAGIEEFHEAEGILIEATATPPGMGTMELPGVGKELLAELAGAEQLASLGAMVADRPAGAVHGRRRAFVRYELHHDDGRRLVRSIGSMSRVLLAAGATEVLTGIATHPRVSSTEQLADALAHAEPRRMHVAAFHPCGTAAAGRDPARFPVDPTGALRGVDRLWVADAAVLPGCAEVNPQVTIMAVALVLARHLAASLGAERGTRREKRGTSR